MEQWQTVLLVGFIIVNLFLFAWALVECRKRKNAYGMTWPLFFLGSFVWGDVVVFSVFWVGAATVSIMLGDWILFWLVFWVFWVVRGLGETIYYFNQQFSEVTRQKPEELPGYGIFRNDSIWFVYQIMAQCMTVIAVICSIYFANLWIVSLHSS